MKFGKSLLDLAQEIERQQASKRDALVASTVMRVHTNGSTQLDIGQPFGLTPIAHRQLGEHLGIPAKWYDTLREHSGDWRAQGMVDTPLLDVTINTLLKARPESERRLVRTLDGNARAILSDRFRPIDNLPILSSILPVLRDRDDLDWSTGSMDVTDRNLYLRVTSTRVEGEVKRGDVVRAGVEIRNSEIGLGAFVVRPLLMRLVCLNGAVVDEEVRRRTHVGASMGEDGAAYEWLSDETLTARSQATILEMRDTVTAALSEAMFARNLARAQTAAGIPMQGNPIKAVEWVSGRYGLNDVEQTDVLRNLFNGGGQSLWDMVNAITLTAQSVESFDRSAEMEQIGGKLLALPAGQIKELVTA